MAIVAVKSAQITNADATPMRINPAYQANSRIRGAVGVAAFANGDSAASVYRILRVRSNDRVERLFLDMDAGGAGAVADFGLYKTAADGGAVVDADFFASAVAIAAAARAVDITRESGAVTVALMEKRIWEQLGLTADPQLEYDVAATLTVATAAAGNMALSAQIAQN